MGEWADLEMAAARGSGLSFLFMFGQLWVIAREFLTKVAANYLWDSSYLLGEGVWALYSPYENCHGSHSL